MNQLNLIKLMLSNHTAHIAPITTSLRSKAWSVGYILDWQLLTINNFIAHQIGHGYLSGRNQVKVFNPLTSIVWVFPAHLARHFK